MRNKLFLGILNKFTSFMLGRFKFSRRRGNYFNFIFYSVLKEGIEFSLKEPILFGKIFLRLERDFDRHALYFRDEPTAQAFLSNNDESLRFFSVSKEFYIHSRRSVIRKFSMVSCNIVNLTSQLLF